MVGSFALFALRLVGLEVPILREPVNLSKAGSTPSRRLLVSKAAFIQLLIINNILLFGDHVSLCSTTNATIKSTISG